MRSVGRLDSIQVHGRGIRVYASGMPFWSNGKCASLAAHCRCNYFPGPHKLGCLGILFVDDYVGVDRPECAEHAMHCMARLVRVIFGRTAVAARKLEFCPSLVALGIRITPSAQGYCCALAEEKAAKCIETIEEAFKVGELHPGVAQKRAGSPSLFSMGWAERS